MTEIIINKELAEKVKQAVEPGLSCGLGSPVPGEMCIEAAVNYACGLPHGDNPPCVGFAVRVFKIALNDKPWSSNDARAKGMIKIAIAQLGSNQIDQQKFVELLSIKTVQRSLSRLMNQLGYNKEAELCEDSSDLPSAIYAAKSAAKSAESAEYAAKYAAEYTKSAEYAKYAAEYAAKSAEYAKYAAEYAAESKYAKSAEYAAEYAAESKYAAKSAAEYAAKYGEYAADEYFIQMADICLECLVELKSPGCEFLYLLD